MKPFMDENFLLNTETAQALYHKYAENMPIIDYHCHLSPEDIAKDRTFKNITEVWLSGDHYKWRYMRSCGVDEKYITGDADDKEKFLKWAEYLSFAIGNPLYHWSHLELKRYFGYDGVLNKDTAGKVWDLCNEKLSNKNMSAKSLIKSSNVEIICTTDDPVDSLEFHKEIAEDKNFKTRVYPAWRPDKALNIEKPDFSDYIKKLSEISNVTIRTFAELKKALVIRMDYFAEMGCKISDHGLDYAVYEPCCEEEAEAIFAKRMSGKAVIKIEELKFKTALLLFLAHEYAKRNWAMQLHYGCSRNNNTVMYKKIGADTGFDCISDFTSSSNLIDFFDALNCDNALPKTVIYSLNPNDNAVIDTICGCFQDSSAVSKIQHGSAWWFNDHKDGIKNHLLSLAAYGNLSGFVGMLTDSRSFLSYTRHEYFRRILCSVIGDIVENGEFTNDEATLSKIVQDISYCNAAKYFFNKI